MHILFLSESKINRVSYSDVYSFTERLKEKYSEQDILSLGTADGRVFFVTRYLLFPTYVYWDSEKRAPEQAIEIEYME